MKLDTRIVPESLANTWSAWDRSLSTQLFQSVGQIIPRRYLKLLEHSGNGLVWLFAAIVLLLTPSVTLPQRCVISNFLVAFVVDLVLIGTLKSVVRRPRPVYNAAGDFILVVSIDQYSFPSGHASRASFVTIFACICLGPQHLLLCLLACLWGVSTAVSRAVMGRHYVGDVCAGVPLGFLTIGIITQGQFHPNGFVLSELQCHPIYSSVQKYLG